MFREEYKKEIWKIPMSDDTISRRKQDMSQDAESQVRANIKEADFFFFTIQLDKSTDVTGRAQPLAISKFVCNGDITEQFLFCKPLPEITKGQDVLEVVDSYFSSCVLSWKPFISICTDGAPSVLGSLKGFVALAKQKNPDIIFTSCFLQ
jgi:hypothetical protein